MTKGHDNSGIGSAMDPEWTPAMDQAVNDARQIERDLQRITAQTVHATMAGLASHLANGCPPGAHHRASLGHCIHWVMRTTGWTATAGGKSTPIQVKEPCGEPLPCPHHPQDVELTDVEADALRRLETDRRVTEVAQHAAQARMAVARLLGSILASERLTAPSRGPAEAVERCCGGWNDAQDPTCTAGAVHHVYRGGVSYAVCDRHYKRCWAADKRKGAA